MTTTAPTDRAADEHEPTEGTVSFSTVDGRPGLTLVDPIDNHRFAMETGSAVEPSPASTAALPVPVDDARMIRTDAISYDTVCAVIVRDVDRTPHAQLERFADRSFERGAYVIELAAPIKLYLRVDAAVDVRTDATRTEIDFGEPTEVVVGARSRHQHPAGTITTPDDPEGMMGAVSAFASALKTTSPERSYPTLRGHPPLVERGSALDVPAGLEAPETGVRLEVPVTHESVFVAAPLAYYLGADLVPGSRPRLVTDDGFEYSLDSIHGFEETVARTLQHLFFMDCLTRTEGFYQVDLHERRAVEHDLDLDFAALYDAPLAEQVEAYLGVPHDVVADQVPEWKLTAQVTPTPDTVEYLPFLVNELAVVRTQADPVASNSIQQATAIDDFTRNDFTRSATGQPAAQPTPIVRPDTAESLSQAWIGEGAPAGASKPSLAAYDHKLDRTPTEEDISIVVVTNDEAMAEEKADVETVYGSREELPLDVSLFQDMTTDRLRLLLESDLDFLHYIGHVEEDGIQCADGKLDVGDLEAVGIDSFLLNACRSYDQGMKLIERGAVGGVVTLRDVINSGAVEIGQTMARLLNRGFPLQAALNLAKDENVVGQQYIVVGDGEVSIAQSESGTPNYVEVEATDQGYRVVFRTYPTTTKGMGSMFSPYIDGVDRFYLNSGRIDTFELTETQLREFLTLENIPVRLGDRLAWSETVDEALF
jgi:hypothetical protein